MILMEWKEGLTQEEYEKAIQSATDKVRTEYVLKVKELEGKLPEEKTERELELEQKEKQLLQREREFGVKDLLEQNKLPSQLSKYLDVGSDDLEVAGTEIANILNEYLLNNSHKPTNRNSAGGDAVTKEQFAKMNYGERAKLEQSSPELYNKLAN